MVYFDLLNDSFERMSYESSESNDLSEGEILF